MDKISFDDIPSFIRTANYRVTADWRYLERQLAGYLDPENGVTLDMNPDFQRGHVWTQEQQIAFVEYALRGGVSGREIYMNCAGWMGDFRGPFVLVDGKQRLEAALSFLQGRIPAFGRYYPRDFTGRIPTGVVFNFSINNLKTRKEVLQWYLEMNSGGTPHTTEELDKVRQMIEQEKVEILVNRIRDQYLNPKPPTREKK
jgi:uncharacterized protein with ParB-like and HNH nuclease domain